MMNLKLPSIFLALMLFVPLSAPAQDARDPTVPPPEVRVAPGAAAVSPLGDEGVAVIVRDGKSFLMVGTRLYAPGEKVGPLRVERITETEVWLRDGKTLHKVPRFADIQRSVTAPLPACATNSAPPENGKKPSKIKEKAAEPKAAPKVVPCDAIPS
jgi:hypothetical protein